MKHFAITCAALAVAGCAETPTPSTGLTRPTASLTARCQPLPDIPRGDGNPAVRRKYYIVTRQMYGDCADSHHGLIRWAQAVVK